MSDYILSCCSTADMPLEYFQQRNIPFVVYHFNMDGQEYPDDLGQTMSFDEFYRRIAAGALPTTSQVNAAQFIEFFEPFLKDGKDILHISLSSGLSGTYNSVVMARGESAAKISQPKDFGRRLARSVFGLRSAGGYGGGYEREPGRLLKKLHAWVEENKLNVHHGSSPPT